MNLKKWKDIYEWICWDRALVLWKRNLPGRGLTKAGNTALDYATNCRRRQPSRLRCQQYDNALESLGDLTHAETLFECTKHNFVLKLRVAICHICETSGYEAVLSCFLLGPILSQINPHSVPSKWFVFRCPVRNSVGTPAIQIEAFDGSQPLQIRLNVAIVPEITPRPLPSTLVSVIHTFGPVHAPCHTRTR